MKAHMPPMRPYRAVAWEEQRVALLRQIEQTEFFGKVRSDLLVSLYNNHEVWAEVRYEACRLSTAGTSIAASMTSTG